MLNTTCHLLRCYLNITYLNMPSSKSMWILFHATYLENEMPYNNKNEVIKYEKKHQLCLKNVMNSDMTLYYQSVAYINAREKEIHSFTAGTYTALPSLLFVREFKTFAPPLHFTMFLNLSSVLSIDFRMCLKKEKGTGYRSS